MRGMAAVACTGNEASVSCHGYEVDQPARTLTVDVIGPPGPLELPLGRPVPIE
jgi:hypothetical protein